MDNNFLMGPTRISHDELRSITGDFCEERILGRGTFGVVYKGEGSGAQEIAVKVIRNLVGAIDVADFEREFEAVVKAKHPNIIQLLGYCNEEKEKLVKMEGKLVIAFEIHRALCFEYMHKGSLHEYLSDEDTGLSWGKRYRIIKGICKGIEYLHTGMERPLYHLDLKPDNILLDGNMAPKITDFGLSRLLGDEKTIRTVTIIGSRGYMPPEFIDSGTISKEYDIFSLGVIIIRIMVGLDFKISEIEPASFSEHVCNKWRKRFQSVAQYASLETSYQQVKRCVEIALKCISNERKQRPAIGNIVRQLNEIEEHINDFASWIEEFDDRASMPPRTNILSWHSPDMPEDPSGGKSSHSEPRLRSTLPQELPLDFFNEITNGFSEERKLSDGPFGIDYKGVLENGEVVTVKKLMGHIQMPQGKKFLNMATYLMAVEHGNIVKLLSCCSETKKKVVPHSGRFIIVDTDEFVLCYEFVPKGSLREYLSDDTNSTDWDTNFKIIKGICEGLRFLHEGYMLGPIVHLDIQPSNILLDFNMVPKVANFGLSQFLDMENSRIFTMNIVGLRGYMAPEYLYSGEISLKSDIYSLGILILEITTGEKNNLSNDDKDMAARNFIDRIRYTWTDEHIVCKYSSLNADRLQEVKACIRIGLECVDVSQKNRPSIAEIVERLNGRAYTAETVERAQVVAKVSALGDQGSIILDALLFIFFFTTYRNRVVVQHGLT